MILHRYVKLPQVIVMFESFNSQIGGRQILLSSLSETSLSSVEKKKLELHAQMQTRKAQS